MATSATGPVDLAVDGLAVGGSLPAGSSLVDPSLVGPLPVGSVVFAHQILSGGCVDAEQFEARLAQRRR